jgi:predicted ATP-grasp superfamily ATP-dependent carboligase
VNRPSTVVIGDHTQGLGIVRSAAAARGDIWVVNDKRVSLARFSRFLTGYRRVPAGCLSQLDRPDVAEALAQVLLELPVDYPSLLCGVNEDIGRFIYRHRRTLGRRYAIPEVPIETIIDKYALTALVPEHARIPTRLCSDCDLDRVAVPRRFILKGRQGNAFRRITGRKAVPLDRMSPQTRRDVFARMTADQILVQELVDTDRPVASICSFSVDGQPTAIFAYEKLREHPSRFGTGTYLRSIDGRTLEPIARQLLERLRFTGISEIEFVFDPRGQAYKIVEMNPRTWKSIHFATRCGQNLVERYLAFLAGRPLPPAAPHAVDRYWVDLATDLPQVIRAASFPPYRGRFAECTWDAKDPWPAVALWTLFPLMALEACQRTHS